MADEERSPEDPQRGAGAGADDDPSRADGVDAESVDEAAYDDYLAALERGAAPGVETFLAGRAGYSNELRERLTRLARRLGRGLDRPERVGPYVVHGVLGAGGMGEVLLAHDPELDRTVALKMLPAAFATDTRRSARLRAEARTLAALDHPNVAIVHAYGVSETGAPYIAMERVEGQDLARRLRAGPLSLADTLALARQVASALEAAHERNILHRDLKPGNVIVRPDGRVKVLDFGLARSVGSGGARATGSGTPGYMSPEQALGDVEGPSSDVWSFGCLVHECLTARRVPALTAGALARGDEVALTPLPSGTPRSLDALVHACLARDAARRPRDGAALARSLAAIAAEAAGQARAELPRSRTRFIGRAALRDLVHARLAEGELVTLVGPGGSGKSRLALEVARDVADASRAGSSARKVVFLELAAVPDEGGVVPALLAAFGIPDALGADPLDLLCAEATRGALVVLDSCEHLLAACAHTAAALTARAHGVTVLATSREPLAARAELVVRVPPLALPEPGAARAAVLASEAVALFVDRLQRAGGEVPSDTEALAEVCRRLDGLPLALELGAARVSALGLGTLLANLEQRFELLVDGPGDGPPRHRSLAALVAWSHDLLEPAERALYARLGVFSDGFTLASAEEVAADAALPRSAVLELLARLVRRSLVDRVGEGGRWRMLETLRVDARARLAASDAHQAVVARHTARFLALGARAAEARPGAERADAFLQLERERLDFTAALERARADAGERARALDVVGRLGEFWVGRGWLRDGRREVAACLAASPDAPPAFVARATVTLGLLEHRMGDYATSEQTYARALELARVSGDVGLIGDALRCAGLLAAHRGDFADARVRYTEALALAEQRGDLVQLGSLYNCHGVVEYFQGRYAEAVPWYEQSLALRRRLGDELGIAGALGNLGEAHHRLGALDLARRELAESLALFLEFGDLRSAAESFEMSASLEVRAGEPARAAALFGVGRGLRARFGLPVPKAEAPLYVRDDEDLARSLGPERRLELECFGRALTLDEAARFVADAGRQPPPRASSS